MTDRDEATGRFTSAEPLVGERAAEAAAVYFGDGPERIDPSCCPFVRSGSRDNSLILRIFPIPSSECE
jgi:hypothetical protein